MPLVSSVKDQSKLPKSLLVGGQCLDRVLLCHSLLENVTFNIFLVNRVIEPLVGSKMAITLSVNSPIDRNPK